MKAEQRENWGKQQLICYWNWWCDNMIALYFRVNEALFWLGRIKESKALMPRAHFWSLKGEQERQKRGFWGRIFTILRHLRFHQEGQGTSGQSGSGKPASAIGEILIRGQLVSQSRICPSSAISPSSSWWGADVQEIAFSVGFDTHWLSSLAFHTRLLMIDRSCHDFVLRRNLSQKIYFLWLMGVWNGIYWPIHLITWKGVCLPQLWWELIPPSHHLWRQKLTRRRRLRHPKSDKLDRNRFNPDRKWLLHL